MNQFRCEYRLLSTLKHRRIVQCIGAYWDATRIILFDEYLTRGSVKDQLQSQWLSEEKAIKYFFQTADALQYLHANNVIHGEIRGTNQLKNGYINRLFSIESHVDYRRQRQTVS